MNQTQSKKTTEPSTEKKPTSMQSGVKLTGDNQQRVNTDIPLSVANDYSAIHGNSHKRLSPNWSYTPIYINKMEEVETIIHAEHPKGGTLLDAGCGEGVQVEKYRKQGLNVTGLDAGYDSDLVTQGSLLEMPFDDASFDTLMCLDVLEHLSHSTQPQAMAELYRVTKPGGTLVFCLPNMAHFTARLKLMFRGKLLRTATLSHHPGDRTALEFKGMLETAGYTITDARGVFPTVPPIYRWVMRYPAKCVGLLRFLRKMPFPHNWCFQVIYTCKKPLVDHSSEQAGE
jgi:2-polyprenyl-3-methyl-5-hydroxy-6-metoxy-1,4-benzoquinol methylase